MAPHARRRPARPENLSLAHLFEGMFLIDNDRVRAGWSDAKAGVVALVEKHGGTVHTARRWDERALAYPIKGRRRATFLLSYYELPNASLAAFTRELELSDLVLRYLQLAAPAVPEGERELHATEQGADFAVPPPPSDDVGLYRPLQNLPEGEEDDTFEDQDDDLDADRPRGRRRDDDYLDLDDRPSPRARAGVEVHG
jgi:ribosomal protein S6